MDTSLQSGQVMDCVELQFTADASKGSGRENALTVQEMQCFTQYTGQFSSSTV